MHYAIRKNLGGNAAQLKHYWTRDPEGLAKWVDARQPWTTLVSHLAKYVRDPEGLAAEYYHAVFGKWPGPNNKGPKRKGKRS